MGISDFFNNMKGEILKNALLKQWIQAHQLEWVDFNNMGRYVIALVLGCLVWYLLAI